MPNNYQKEKLIVERRISAMERNGMRHLSCTISPAPKDIAHNEIESLLAGLDYYRAEGIEKVILQDKWMGSYVVIYLYSNLEDTKFFSRGGYVINHLDRGRLLNAVRSLHSTLIKDNITEAVCEAELMPWSALGDGLINREFKNYYQLHTDNLQFLMNSSIAQKLKFLLDSKSYKEYTQDKSNAKSHVKRQYEALEALVCEGVLPNTYQYAKSLNLYKEQLDKYGRYSDDFWVEPFNLVYTVRDGVKELNTDNSYFFPDAPILDLNNFDAAVRQGYEYLQYKKDIEGIMIKPLQSRILGIPHALKVRNNSYLQLIYGIKFDKDYEYYLTRRKVERKIKASVKDYEIHCALNCAETPQARKKWYLAALDQERFIEQLDKRL
jgi:hypothetical protein